MSAKIEAWALMRNGKIVLFEEHHLKPMLIFKHKSTAQNAVWQSGEKPVKVSIVVTSTDEANAT